MARVVRCRGAYFAGLMEELAEFETMAAASQTVVMINPIAGGGRAGRLWRRLRSAAPELGNSHLVRRATAEASREELIAHLESGARRVIVIGGDGTTNLVVGTLLAEGYGDRVDLGLVPAGTGSDLARSLGLPRNPVAALRHVLVAEPRSIDALRFETESGERRYAVNTTSAGMSGAIAPAVNANTRRGRLSYLTTTLAALLRYRPVPCRLEVDGEPFYDGEFFLAAFVNGRYFGNGMPIAPEARLDDGLIDVVLIPPVPLWHLPYRLPQFLTGRLIHLDLVTCCRAERIRLEPAAGFPPFEVDGECLESGSAEIRILPGALRILA